MVVCGVVVLFVFYVVMVVFVLWCVGWGVVVCGGVCCLCCLCYVLFVIFGVLWSYVLFGLFVCCVVVCVVM